MGRAFRSLALAGAILGLGVEVGLAQEAPYYPPSPRERMQPRSYNPNEGVQLNGCVKLCPLDTNPCDPPEYKRADGRCNLKD